MDSSLLKFPKAILTTHQYNDQLNCGIRKPVDQDDETTLEVMSVQDSGQLPLSASTYPSPTHLFVVNVCLCASRDTVVLTIQTRMLYDL